MLHQEVITNGIERIAVPPGLVRRPQTFAEFDVKNLITQSLRCGDILRALRQIKLDRMRVNGWLIAATRVLSSRVNNCLMNVSTGCRAG